MLRVLLPICLFFAQTAQERDTPKPLFDNARVTVWSITSAGPSNRSTHDGIAVDLIHIGQATFVPKGKTPDDRQRGILIELKDASVPPLANKTKYPNAFPREGVKKVLENDRVIVWDYTWTPGKPTAMHFHDKDVVVVYTADGELSSTTPDGESVVNPISFGLARFNARDRIHSEQLVKGSARATIVELK